MKAKLTALAVLAVVAASSQARAQNEMPPVAEKTAEPLAEAPVKALEIVVGTGYTQGFGSFQSGVNMQDVITPGIGVDLGLAYRINPRWGVGIAGQYQEFAAERALSARGLSGELAATYHFLPFNRIDPFLKFGAGYRLLWENHDTGTPSLMTHGFELGKVVFGVDIRANRDVSIAPIVGAAVDALLWQSTSNQPSVAIQDPTLSLYAFAGVQARFDITSKHEGLPKPPQPVVVTQAQVTPPPPPPEPAKPVSPSIAVEDEVLKACLIHLDNVDSAPKFDFDKSALRDADMPVLQKIAECFSTGPLKNESIKLVGRADPRGSDAYNEALGLRRADAVASFLEKNGVTEGRIFKSSRGEADAKGTDEATWQTDRRVDLSRVEIRISRR
jgi:peptidoglycan-associated lipoprotein